MSEEKNSSADDGLQDLLRGWKTEQKIIEERIQVYKKDRESFTRIVEEVDFCKVLLPGNNEEQKNYYVAGVDIGWPNPPKDSQEDPLAAAVYIVMDSRTMEIVYRDHEWLKTEDIPPYVSTFLSFREIDPLERLVQKQLATRPELTPAIILVDGNGIFHPRHAGIACFLGVRTNIPTIGIGKTLLFIGSGREDNQDDYHWTRKKLDERINGVLQDLYSRISCDEALASRLKEHKGLILPKNTEAATTNDDKSRDELLQALSPVCNGIAIPLEAPGVEMDERFEILGTALIGHGGSKAAFGSKRPIIVSVGHKLSQSEAASIAAALSLHRIPEPVRAADLYGRDLLREKHML